MADSIDTRFRHLRSHTPEHSNHELAPDQQSIDLEPLGLESAKVRVSRVHSCRGSGRNGSPGRRCPAARRLPRLKSQRQEQAEAAGGSTITLRVNGKDYTLKNLDPRATLLDTLRERIHLTGTKKGCDHGQCGACTVHVNGRRVN